MKHPTRPKGVAHVGGMGTLALMAAAEYLARTEEKPRFKPRDRRLLDAESALDHAVVSGDSERISKAREALEILKRETREGE